MRPVATGNEFNRGAQGSDYPNQQYQPQPMPSAAAYSMYGPQQSAYVSGGVFPLDLQRNANAAGFNAPQPPQHPAGQPVSQSQYDMRQPYAGQDSPSGNGQSVGQSFAPADAVGHAPSFAAAARQQNMPGMVSDRTVPESPTAFFSPPATPTSAAPGPLTVLVVQQPQVGPTLSVQLLSAPLQQFEGCV